MRRRRKTRSLDVHDDSCHLVHRPSIEGTAIPKEIDQLEKARVTEFVQTQWTDLCVKLGERVGEFVEAAWRNAASYELHESGSAARFLNLCCALGPGFDRNPQNEWALAILLDDRLTQWVKLHQLVVRGAGELKRRADGARISAQLLRADALLLDRLDQQSGAGGEPAAVARCACDLEAVELRLLETEWRREYRKVDGTWKFLPLSDAVPALRINSAESIPRAVSVLTQPPDSAVAARLQVRSLKHALCNQDRHPLLTFAGAHGLTSFNGHSATAASWPVYCEPVPVGAGVALLEETMPQPNLLRVGACGLRDEGVPLGSIETFVFAYPSHQWLAAVQRDKGLALQWPRQETQADIPPRTRCRVERDGKPVDSRKWVNDFNGLDAAVSHGFDRLFAAWQESASDTAMTLSADLLVGSAELSWGWRESTDGLAGHPLTRVALDFALGNELACSLMGEVVLGATRTRVRLIVEGGAPMKHCLTRQVVRGGLPEVLLPIAVQWRSLYRLEFDPVAVEGGAMWSEIMSCTGALDGEVGLRPRLTGGGGWQWYVRLTSECVSAYVRVHDPVLGQTTQSVDLLPQLKLLDWSQG